MWSRRQIPAAALGVLVGVIAVGIAMAAPGATVKRDKLPEAPAAQASVQPVVRDTRGNLQAVFDNEVNAKVRYLEAAKVADREGYRYVALVFRACARAEQVHAGQHVQAIAWTGGEARALLKKLALGTTAENLKVAVDLETYEATQLYPALLAHARAEHMTAAVRSMNFALAAEREHARLFTAALETLDQRPAPRAFHVCALCGKTVEKLDFEKCPNCFTLARKFIRVE